MTKEQKRRAHLKNQLNWVKRHPERAKALNNSASHRALSKKWHQENPEYISYMRAKRRCQEGEYKGFVKFKFTSFKQFLKSVGARPSLHHSLDRVNPFGNYEPGNVIWGTKDQQELHKRGVIRELFRLGFAGIKYFMDSVRKQNPKEVQA